MRTESSPPAGEHLAVQLPRPAHMAVLWLRENLFNSWLNSILTLVALLLIYKIASGLISWAFLNAAIGFGRESCDGSTGACWSFVLSNWYLFGFGTYPYDQRWRPILAFGAVIVLGLVSLSPRMRARWVVRGLWLASPVFILVMVRGFSVLNLRVVDSANWGGLMLTLILATVGIGVSFPIGIMLALGRRSRRMPIIRSLCVVYIEVIRGVPLITVLFMSSVVIPLFFPEGFNLDKVLRAQIGIILFASAYLAEVVRGGLQAIPRGQEEAAQALGLNYWQMTGFIVLPQALRIMIPALVSGAIGLFKDTSLVTIIGLIDFLSIAALATANPKWLGMNVEAYVFIGAVYWIFCFTMSRWSQRLEARLQAGRSY